MKDTLKYLRIQNDLSQNKVAEYLGISRQMYIKYESGETEPTVKCIRELSKLYKVSYDILIDDKYREEGKRISERPVYDLSNLPPNLMVDSPSAVLEVHSPTPAYSASHVSADSLNFRHTWDLLFKLNPDDLVRIATKALKLAERKKEKTSAEQPEMSMEEKMRLFKKFSGSIKDVKIEDWKSEKMKYLEEKYGL